MKRFLFNKVSKPLVIVALASLISILSHSFATTSNVPFCIQAAGCNFSIEPKGQITEQQYGYPLSYKKTSTFTPEHNNQNDPKYAGYAEATTVQQELNVLNILINVVFWSALLLTIARFLFRKQNAK